MHFLRSSAKWLATAGLLFAIVVWIGSFYYCFYGVFPSRWLVIDVQAGNVYLKSVGRSPFVQFGHWDIWRAPTVDYSSAPGFDLVTYTPLVHVKLWVPVAVLVVPVAFCWTLNGRAALRRRNGCCTKCGYDRRGIAPNAKCPECGTLPATTAA